MVNRLANRKTIVLQFSINRPRMMIKSMRNNRIESARVAVFDRLFFYFRPAQAAELSRLIAKSHITLRTFVYQIMSACWAELFRPGPCRHSFCERAFRIGTNKIVHGFSPYIITCRLLELILHFRTRVTQCLKSKKV